MGGNSDGFANNVIKEKEYHLTVTKMGDNVLLKII